MTNLILQGYGARARPLTQGYIDFSDRSRPVAWFPRMGKSKPRPARPFRGK